MPGEPRADQSPSTVGGHHQAVKEMRLRMQETKGSGGVEARTGRKDPWPARLSARLTLLRSAGYPQLSSAPSWTERNSARRTRASSRETSAGRPSDPSPGLSSDSEQPARPGSGRGRHLSGIPPNEVTDTSPSLGRRGFLIAPGTQRSGRTTAPTDQACQLGPQFCRGLVGAAAIPGLAAGILGGGAGEALEERPGSLPPGSGPQGSLLAT